LAGSQVCALDYRTSAVQASRRDLLRRLLDEGDLVVGQAVQLVNQLVDLPIRRINLPLDYGVRMARIGRSTCRVPICRHLTRPPAF